MKKSDKTSATHGDKGGGDKKNKDETSSNKSKPPHGDSAGQAKKNVKGVPKNATPPTEDNIAEAGEGTETAPTKNKRQKKVTDGKVSPEKVGKKIDAALEYLMEWKYSRATW
jgi:hypothetical protein